MRDIHPHWHADDGDPVPVHGKTEPVETSAPTGQTISRRPAALVGMSIVIVMGFVFFNGVEHLTGQIANQKPGVTIRITELGLLPPRVEVEHGQTITFENEQDIPHILESDRLCSDTGFCLQTSTLFQGDKDNFTITLDIQPGSYPYFSSLSDTLRGEIVIIGEGEAEAPGSGGAQNEFTDLFDPATPLPPQFNEQPAPGGGIAQNTALPQVPLSANIPTNPYTVDSARMHPFDGAGEPIPEAFGDEPGSGPTPNTARLTATRRPLRQPETGPGVWIAVFASVGLLWAMTRDLFAEV